MDEPTGPVSRDTFPGPGWLAGSLALLVAGLGLLAYSNSLDGPFVFDDLRNIRDYPTIRHLSTYFQSTQGYREAPNRVFGYLSFALNYRLGGLEPRGYHVVNLAIHIASALLVFALCMVSFRTPRVRGSVLSPVAPSVAFLASALFVTHPLGTQAVSYIVQRFASLTTCLYLLSVVLYVRWRLDRGRLPRLRGALLYVGLLVASLLAFRTKETSITLPGAILLAEILLFEGGGWRRFLPVLPVALLALVIPATVLLGSGAPGTAADQVAAVTRLGTPLATPVGRLDYLRTQTVVVVEYLRMLALPSGLSLDHDVPVRHSFLEPRVLLSTGLLLGLALLGAWLAVLGRPRAGRRSLDPASSLAAFGIAWFFLTLSVESGLIPIVDLMYEHRAYLPSVGVYLAIAVGFGLAFRRVDAGATSRALVLLGVALALVLGSLTLRRNTVWTSELALWTDAVEKAPGKFRPVYNLATSLISAGRIDEAYLALRRAVTLNPESQLARAQLGAVLLGQGRYPEAERELQEAVRLAPSDPDALMNLGQALLRLGRVEEAKVQFRRFLEVAPPSYGAARRAAEAALAR